MFLKNCTLKCFSFSTNNYSFKGSILALHSIPIVKEEAKEHMHLILRCGTTLSFLPHFDHICSIRAMSTGFFLFFSKAKR